MSQEDHSTMALPFFRRKRFAFICLAFLLLVGLAACSADGAPGASQSPTTPSPNGATATAAVEALMKEMTLVGTPTARIDIGTTFEVDGYIKNGDSKQHDIYIQAVLLDASGKTIATTSAVNVDDVPGGATVPFSIQGTTPQPTWARVRVLIVNVKENVNGTGTD